MMRQLFHAILFLFLTACATNVSARSDQGRVAYVQIGDSVRLKVDLERQKVEPFLESAPPSPQDEIQTINHDNDGIDVSSFASLEGCWRLKADWRALPIQSGSTGLTTANRDWFVIASGILIDTKKNLYLSGICPGTVTSAVISGDVLLFARREVTGAFANTGRVLGLEYSGREIITRVDARGASPSDISRLAGKVKTLSLDPVTGNVLVIREVSRTKAGPGSWLRALAGHPKQTSEYDLVLIDKSTRAQKAIRLSLGEPGQAAIVWF